MPWRLTSRLLATSLCLAGLAWADTASATGLDEAITAYRAGRYEAARTLLVPIHQAQPEQLTATYYLAMSEAQLGHYPQAKQLYEQVILLDPNSPEGKLAKQGLENLRPALAAAETPKLDAPPRFAPSTAQPRFAPSAVPPAQAAEAPSPLQVQPQATASPSLVTQLKNRFFGKSQPQDAPLSPPAGPTAMTTPAAGPISSAENTAPPAASPVAPVENRAVSAREALAQQQQARQYVQPAQPQAAQPAYPGGFSPQDLMLMQMMMGGGNNNNQQNNMMWMMPGMSAMSGVDPNAGGYPVTPQANPYDAYGGAYGQPNTAMPMMDPSVMSTLMMNQMLGNFNFDSKRDEE